VEKGIEIKEKLIVPVVVAGKVEKRPMRLKQRGLGV
jgi:hypothetical protein